MRQLLLIYCFIFSIQLVAQTTIETVPVLKKQVAYDFPSEWQYLSTDLYLFNPEKFELLLNDMLRQEKIAQEKKWRKSYEETIHNLIITSKINNVLGGNLTFPLYSFRMEEVRGGFSGQISKHAEVVRILDNLPLNTTNDYIEAEITAQLFSHSNKDKIYGMVSTHMKNIAKLTNPTTAVLSVVGEFGKFMEASAESKQYCFASTIRLYQEQDFNKRLHSLHIYIFQPTGNNEAFMRTAPIEQYVDSNEYPEINHKIIADLLKFRRYPYLVVANYKSRYISQPVSGDEVDFEYIEKRKQDTDQAFSTDLINRETYQQESQLIDFLRVFAQLKIDMQNFELNYKNKITDDFSQSFFLIMKQYRVLKQMYANRIERYSNVSLFKNDYKEKYESILLNAELYLDVSPQLKNIKELVNTLFELNAPNNASPDSATRETYLRKLYAVQLPKSEQRSDEAKIIQMTIAQLEQEHYNKVYYRAVEQLNSVAANDQSIRLKELLKNSIKATNCAYCREKVNQSIKKYNQNYEIYKVQKEQQQLNETIKAARGQSIVFFMKKDCIDQKLNAYDNDSIPMPAYVKLFAQNVATIHEKLEQLTQTITEADKNTDAEKLAIYTERITALMANIEREYDAICGQLPQFCNCE